MSRRAFTLFELTLGVTVLGLIGVLGGKLLTGSMNQWRADAGRVAVERAAATALHALAEDLQTQVNLPTWPKPFHDDWRPDDHGQALPLFSFPRGSDGPVAVVWLIERKGSASSLWRLQASPEQSRVALPENAALVLLMEPQDDQDLQAMLNNQPAHRFCENLRSLEVLHSANGFYLSIELEQPSQNKSTRTPIRAHTHVSTPTLGWHQSSAP